VGFFPNSATLMSSAVIVALASSQSAAMLRIVVGNIVQNIKLLSGRDWTILGGLEVRKNSTKKLTNNPNNLRWASSETNVR
jgi:hypothetical protein